MNVKHHRISSCESKLMRNNMGKYYVVSITMFFHAVVNPMDYINSMVDRYRIKKFEKLLLYFLLSPNDEIQKHAYKITEKNYYGPHSLIVASKFAF